MNIFKNIYRGLRMKRKTINISHFKSANEKKPAYSKYTLYYVTGGDEGFHQWASCRFVPVLRKRDVTKRKSNVVFGVAKDLGSYEESFLEALIHQLRHQENTYKAAKDLFRGQLSIMQDLSGKKTLRSIEIWMEGNGAQGNACGAQKIGTYMATDFDDAVNQYMKDRPVTVELDRYGKGRHAIWACELFDNEVEARKAFG